MLVEGALVFSEGSWRPHCLWWQKRVGLACFAESDLSLLVTLWLPCPDSWASYGH